MLFILECNNTDVVLATTVYCLLIYKIASSMNIYSVLCYIYIYTLVACLGHHLHILGEMTQLASLLGINVHAENI